MVLYVPPVPHRLAPTCQIPCLLISIIDPVTGHIIVCVYRWRFGMTVWEVSSLGDIPFADTPNRTLSEMVKSGQRPQAPENCSGRL